MKNNELDNIIRKKLEGIEPSYDPKSWKLLEQKLDGSAVTDSKSTADAPSVFDSLIAAKVNSLHTPYDDASWAAMERKLDGESASVPLSEREGTQIFDDIIFEKLYNYHAPYSSRAWQTIVAQFEHILQVERSFYRLKLLEAAVLGILLLMVNHLAPLKQQPFPTTPAIPQIEKPLYQGPIAQTGESVLEEEIAGTLEVTAEIATEIESTTKFNVPQKSASARQSEPKDEISNSLAILLEGSQSNPLSDNNLFPQDPHHGLAMDFEPLPQLATMFVETDQGVLLAENNFPNLSRADDLSLALADNQPLHIFTVAALPTASLEILEPQDRELGLKGIKPLKKKKSIRGSMFGSLDFNQIITPPNYLERRFKEFDRYAIGYSTGFTLSFGRGRWEMETGMIYSAKYYSPPTVLFIISGNIRDGYLAEGLKYFELDIYNIPLNFRYNYVNSGKWRAYAMLGASLQIAGQTHYYTATQDGFSNANHLAPTPTNSVGSPSAGFSQTKDIFDGWLEGGPFKENSYISLNFGAGVERYISTRFSAFVQPTYQYSFDYLRNVLSSEIGPDRDKINTMSIYTGIRVRISN